MIVAIDTNCILPGQVGGIENYTLGLVEAMQHGESPASRLILITRPENHRLFDQFTNQHTTAVMLDRPRYDGKPITNWTTLLKENPTAGRRTLADFQDRKASLLQRYRVDVVHFPGNTINPLDLDLPVVLNLHDLQHRHFPEYFTPEELSNREKWWTASAHRADALIAASNYVRDDLHQQLHVDRDKIFVTPDVFESAFLRSPTTEQLRDLQKRFSLPRSFLIYPAAVWPHKNHERLIRAFVSADVRDTQLILTGGGQEQSALPGLIADLGAQSTVRLLGRVSTEDLVGLYHLATALIFPSLHESWSIPIMEAMACGCPVACSNVTSLPEEIGDAGLIFPPENHDLMVDAINRLSSDENLRRQLAARGKQRVKLFNRAAFTRIIASAYHHAIANHRARKAA